MTTDTQRKLRGLCETLGSACASAAACHRALAALLPADSVFRAIHARCAEHYDSLDVATIYRDHLTELGLAGELDTAWPDALERTAQESGPCAA
jgi:hypothetical protein